MEEFTVKLSIEELKYIEMCLQERPFKEVAPIMANLKIQIEDQTKKETNSV